MGSNSWLCYPTEAGWWWSRRDGDKPEMCLVVVKKLLTRVQAMALFPERGCTRYLDHVVPGIQYQRVPSPSE